MKLYHGTSSRHKNAILGNGIVPRGRKKGNFSHSIPSSRHHVYLTNAYPIHFATNALRTGDMFGDDLLIIEIDTELLNPWRLHPDEDCLEQATRDMLLDGCPPYAKFNAQKSMHDRTRFFRRNLPRFQEKWMDSIVGLGTCCHEGVVPKSAITRYAQIDAQHPLRWMSDPQIVLENYAIMGPWYRDLVRAAFGDQLVGGHDAAAMEGLKRVPRDGIEVAELDWQGKIRQVA